MHVLAGVTMANFRLRFTLVSLRKQQMAWFSSEPWQQATPQQVQERQPVPMEAASQHSPSPTGQEKWQESANNQTIGVQAAVEPKVNIGQRVKRLPVLPKSSPLPPLQDVVNAMKQGNDTAGQFMIDVAIIGHAKCGTSTLMLWLGQNQQCSIPPDELPHLQRKEPWDMVASLYRWTNMTEPNLLRGYKSPRDVNDVRAVRLLREFFPKTKLIVGLRHPIWMLQSFYHHRVQNGFDIVPLEKIPLHNMKRSFGVSLSRADYQISLSNLRKTNPWSNTSERALFPLYKRQEWEKNKPNDTVNYPFSQQDVLIYDTEQLGDLHRNQTRLQVFMEDLQNFLGLTVPLKPPLHFSPGKKLNPTLQAERDAKKANICDDKYSHIRARLVQMGTMTQEWILRYFWDRPGVHVSNRDHFESVLRQYSRDPCLDRDRKDETQNKNATAR